MLPAARAIRSVSDRAARGSPSSVPSVSMSRSASSMLAECVVNTGIPSERSRLIHGADPNVYSTTSA